jgi:hypothetical protein
VPVPGTTAATITPASSFMPLGVRQGRTDQGVDIIQWYVDGGSEQNWYFDLVGHDDTRGNRVYEIRNQNSGLCITTDTHPGDPVRQISCNPTNSLQWWESTSPSSNYPAASLLFNPVAGLVLDVYGNSYNAGAEIDVWYENDGLNQQFYAAVIGAD